MSQARALSLTAFLTLLLIVILRYNQRSNPTPARFTHNTPLEIVWTLIPALILVAMAVGTLAWANLHNRLVWIALSVTLAFGASNSPTFGSTVTVRATGRRNSGGARSRAAWSRCLACTWLLWPLPDLMNFRRSWRWPDRAASSSAVGTKRTAAAFVVTCSTEVAPAMTELTLRGVTYNAPDRPSPFNSATVPGTPPNDPSRGR